MAVTPGRVALAVLPTPLTAAPRLADALGLAGRLLVKRDDLTGFAVAGNKARPLEVLLADAAAAGASVIVTGGATGSNFAAAAVAAAAYAGLPAVVVYAGTEPDRQHPNLAAARHWGARIQFTGDPARDSVDAGIADAAAKLEADGERPFPIPRGGATARSAAGFHWAAGELAGQLGGAGGRGRVTVITATGSGGTLAGLVSGTVALGRPWRLAGVSVSRPPAETRERVLAMAAGCARELGTPAPGPDDVELADGRGPGHGIASAEGRAAAALALETAGLVLDPVYTAKALAALPGILGQTAADPDLTTIFWHTGGLLDAVDEITAKER
ncbi:MAG: pyridoxal-phosphate dependent enzyme [Actinobacteria bacterium]|nr:pyridoxal-phosphate dependent enzyme [Actinomycetota bacterium]